MLLWLLHIQALRWVGVRVRCFANRGVIARLQYLMYRKVLSYELSHTFEYLHFDCRLSCTKYGMQGIWHVTLILERSVTHWQFVILIRANILMTRSPENPVKLLRKPNAENAKKIIYGGGGGRVGPLYFSRGSSLIASSGFLAVSL